uniref:Poor homologous synapsis 1 PH domain-containing protein n=1 Tax=Oryza glumipatula TaxID=40148 RepID=A0A0E0A9M1_9ORYZ
MVNAGNQRERGVLLRAAAPRRWEVEFARYIPAPRQAGPPAPPGLRRITRGKAAPPPRGRVAPRRVPRGAPRVEPRPPLRGPVLTVSIGDVVYVRTESAPLAPSSFRFCCGHTTLCATLYMSLLMIEKFAVRFPQPCDAESFLNCVKVYTSGVLQDVVAAKEMTADKVEGAGKEIDITIKRGGRSSACENAQFGVDGGSCCDPRQPGDQRTNELALQHCCGTNRSPLWFSDNIDTIMLPPFCNGHGRAKRGRVPGCVSYLLAHGHRGGNPDRCRHNAGRATPWYAGAGMKPWSAMPTGSPSEGASTHRLPVSDEQECYPASRRRRVLASPIRPCILLRAGELPDDSDGESSSDDSEC